ncbi:glycosyltransferase family 4 protein [Mucilaginibacter corticis]|uniref:Glycosyltransferase family 4 protein n=1 Tax=Mucilaginibacter corticis TaxID=2597670 RepID=A0A556M915_9SPHI|nr:glycosyltransferase [Mucilaginibacter corticis]TSJ36399.1 glycosyltransferase family 4 protein [Mucilaginibacter corticis]
MLTIVVSGVNMVEGGILSILRDVMKSLSHLKNEVELSVIVLVHDEKLIAGVADGFTILPFKDIKSSWMKRLRFEYVTSKKIAAFYRPDIWISLHDMTPNVACDYQVVYCHNPSPFYQLSFKEIFYDSTFTLFTIFYKYLYRINIRKNAFVIVQQNWIRRAFKSMYGVDCIVAYPKFAKNLSSHSGDHAALPFHPKPGHILFFYPSFPRVFKNMECVCEAAEILSHNFNNFSLLLTMNGSENKYAAKIHQAYKHISQIEFLGIQPREMIEKYYRIADCLIFPSKLETWGLPVSEFIPYEKPILIADEPYAHETVGNYSKVKFFDVNDPGALAEEMARLMDGQFVPDHNFDRQPAEPFYDNWDDLLRFLIDNRRTE